MIRAVYNSLAKDNMPEVFTKLFLMPSVWASGEQNTHLNMIAKIWNLKIIVSYTKLCDLLYSSWRFAIVVLNCSIGIFSIKFYS